LEDFGTARGFPSEPASQSVPRDSYDMYRNRVKSFAKVIVLTQLSWGVKDMQYVSTAQDRRIIGGGSRDGCHRSMDRS